MRHARRPLARVLALGLGLALLAALFGSGVCAAATRRCCCKPATTVALCKASCCVQRAAERARVTERVEPPVFAAAPTPLETLTAPLSSSPLVLVDHAPPARIGDGPAFRLRL